jgi:hypothetical protein
MDGVMLAELDRALPRGLAHATSIPALVARLGVSERIVRAGIEQLVNGDMGRRVPVVTLSVAPGVFVAVTPQEVDMADAHLRSKAMSLLHRRRSLRLCREQLAFQPTLF